MTIFAQALPSPAIAQDMPPAATADSTAQDESASATDAAEIVVTAQKRAQNLQDTPLSISALNAAAVENRGVVAIDDLVRVSPGINIAQQWGVNRLFIRGIGLTAFAVGSDPSSAFYVDGVYIGTASAQLTSFFDVERVEVVRGPQGTLYGRNATGGAVNLISRAPSDEFGGYLDLTLGNYDKRDIAGAVTGPLTQDGRLTGRIAFKLAKRDGFGRNIATGEEIDDENSQAARLGLRYEASERVDLTLSGEYFHQKDSAYFTGAFGPYPGYELFGAAFGPVLLGKRDTASALSGDTNRREGYATALTAEVELSDSVSLQSITAYRHFRRHNDVDIDNTAGVLPDGFGIGDGFSFEKSKQFSEELQLNYSDDRLDLVAGLYYFHQNLENRTYFPFTQFAAFGDEVFYIEEGDMDVNAYAAFTQATYSILPNFRLTAGARYSIEKRSTAGTFHGILVPPVPTSDSDTWNSFTPKGGIEYDLTDDVLFYATVSKGFKSGTFNVGQNNPPINPEKLTAYEAGLKARLLDRRLDVSSAVFYYDYTDLQVNKIIGITTLTTNAASAENKGVELSARARLTDYFSVDGDLTYLDATFKEFDSVNPLRPMLPPEDLRGNQLPGATKWAVNFGGELEVPAAGGQVFARLSGSYRSRVYFTEFNDRNLSQKANTKFDATLRYTSGNEAWSVALWGKNITDEKVVAVQTMGVPVFGYPRYGSFEAPATYGVTLGVRF